MDEKTEKQLLQWYEEIQTDEEALDTDGDLSDRPSEHNDYQTDTEQSGNEEQSGNDLNDAMDDLQDVLDDAKQAKTIMDCWKLFVSDEMIKDIVKYTNQRLDLMRSSYQRPRDYPQTDYEEILAFIGLLYMAGVKKGQHLNTEKLWKSDGTAPDFFAATMSKKRFHQLVQSIRFDDAIKRLEISAIDNLALNKSQIPRELLEVKGRPVKSSMFAYGKKLNCLLVSYIPKPNKYVLLLSTLHNDDKIDEKTGEACKPEVITDYNLS
ncbi:hypothetical protein NQ314_001937 [Rhamnusium bicolor]|uniref:PiggyBac transposable element-derived protein domain-containing protein n=1 Tax=Rhamnusium bicolor TaxID=1586634 RepID=A0AAV8ZTQ1_9CUCU|nr:hypothetical protein NQ314_001937 [Rhamnusium bicolor]